MHTHTPIIFTNSSSQYSPSHAQMDEESCLSNDRSSKNKKNPPRENFLYSGETKLSNSNIKKLLIFSQKKAFFMFWEKETPEKFLIFHETELSYISGNGTFRARKIKNSHLKSFLYFRRNFQSLKNENLLYFFKKSCEKFFPKTLLDNSFHPFYKLNQTLLVYKNIESFLLCFIFFQLFDIFYFM